MALLLGPDEVIFGVAGLVNLGLAGLLLYINFSSRLNRAFAIFLTIRGMLNLTRLLYGTPGEVEIGEQLRPYFLVAVPFAALYFGLSYQAFHGTSRRRDLTAVVRIAGISIALVAIALEGLYAGDHALYAADLDSSTQARGAGPLYAFAGLNLLSYAVLALMFTRSYLRVQSLLHRRSLLLVALGFALNPLFFFFDNLLIGTPTALTQAGRPWPELLVDVWTYAAGGLVLWMAVLLARRLRGQDREARREARRALSFLASAAGSALVLLPTEWWRPDSLTTVASFLGAFWVGALAVLVTYALLKHQLFGIDLKVKATVKQTTVGAVFLSVFFTVSESAQTVFSRQIGPYAGIMATGALLFAIQPLQRLADRVAGSALPDAKPVSAMTGGERADIYREQVRVAWADGVLTVKDRKLLALARERLGLSFAAAEGIEREVVG